MASFITRYSAFYVYIRHYYITFMFAPRHEAWYIYVMTECWLQDY